MDTSKGRRWTMNGRIVIVILINIYTELLDFPVCFHIHCKKKVLLSKTACCCWHMEFYSTREMTFNRMYAWFWVDRSVLMNAWRADFYETHHIYHHHMTKLFYKILSWRFVSFFSFVNKYPVLLRMQFLLNFFNNRI